MDSNEKETKRLRDLFNSAVDQLSDQITEAITANDDLMEVHTSLHGTVPDEDVDPDGYNLWWDHYALLIQKALFEIGSRQFHIVKF